MNRRSFLSHSTLATIAAWFPASWFAGKATNAHLYAEPELLHIIDAPEKVQAIGTSYRTAYPEFDSTDKLLQALKTAEADVKNALNTQVRHDFEQGNVVQVEGWILSTTEARQCALYTLLYV